MTKYIVAAMLCFTSMALADKACDQATNAEKKSDASCKAAWRSCPQTKNTVRCSPSDVNRATRVCKESEDRTAARQEACKQCR